MKLLLIEDNNLFADRLRLLFSNGYYVDLASTAEEGLILARDEQYSVIVLDIEISGTNGIDVCKTLRKQNIETPILILASRSKIEQQIEALYCGADDFILKSTSDIELCARVDVLMRRRERQYNGAQVAVNDLIVDTHKREVARHGRVIILRRKEFDILEYLIVNKNRPVSRAMIFDHVWERDKINTNNTVDVHIKNLRDKIDKPFEDSMIITAYGIGYMLDLKSD